MNQQYIEVEDSTRNGYFVAVGAYNDSIGISSRNTTFQGVTTYISYNDARKLVEMLIKHTHPGHTIEPSNPTKTPKLILAWQSTRDGLRYTVDVDSEADATSRAVRLKRSNPETPIRLALIIKEFVQPTPSYEWKDL